jgi:hypothetical protein
MYCGGMICGVEVLQAYPDVVVLYAHTACHARDERTTQTATTLSNQAILSGRRPFCEDYDV